MGSSSHRPIHPTSSDVSMILIIMPHQLRGQEVSKSSAHFRCHRSNHWCGRDHATAVRPTPSAPRQPIPCHTNYDEGLMCSFGRTNKPLVICLSSIVRGASVFFAVRPRGVHLVLPGITGATKRLGNLGFTNSRERTQSVKLIEPQDRHITNIESHTNEHRLHQLFSCFSPAGCPWFLDGRCRSRQKRESPRPCCSHCCAWSK